LFVFFSFLIFFKHVDVSCAMHMESGMPPIYARLVSDRIFLKLLNKRIKKIQFTKVVI
jgi:hypothetical protein